MDFLTRFKSTLIRRRYKAKLTWLGLDHAGKTTLIRRIITGEFNENLQRTMGLDLNRIIVHGDPEIEFVSWDLGGQIAFRSSIWISYLEGSDAIIFVVDAADRERFEEAKHALWSFVIKNKTIDERIPILILANKQDLPNALDVGILANSLELHKAELHSYMILGVSALSGKGIQEALDWLGQRVATLK